MYVTNIMILNVIIYRSLLNRAFYIGYRCAKPSFIVFAPERRCEIKFTLALCPANCMGYTHAPDHPLRGLHICTYIIQFVADVCSGLRSEFFVNLKSSQRVVRRVVDLLADRALNFTLSFATFGVLTTVVLK